MSYIAASKKTKNKNLYFVLYDHEWEGAHWGSFKASWFSGLTLRKYE